MRPLDVNLLHKRLARSAPGWLLLAAMGGIAAADQSVRIIELRASLRAVADQAYAQSARAADAARPLSGSHAAPPAYLDDARAVAALAAFDLEAALKAVESLREPGLRVAAAVIDARERRVRLDIEVSDTAQIAVALATLNAGAPTPPWRLVQAQAGGTGQAVRVTLEMRP